jgi:hypothetical protein
MRESRIPTKIPGKTKADLRNKAKDKSQIASLPPQSLHRGSPMNRPTSSRLTAFVFILLLELRESQKITWGENSQIGIELRSRPELKKKNSK